LIRLNRDYENHHVLEINREPMHVPLAGYASRDGGARRRPTRIDVPHAARRAVVVPALRSARRGPVRVFAADDFDASGWDRIAVPGNVGDAGARHPIYTNVKYPFGIDAGFAAPDRARTPPGAA
jgi:beta-galactosidase